MVKKFEAKMNRRQIKSIAFDKKIGRKKRAIHKSK